MACEAPDHFRYVEEAFRCEYAQLIWNRERWYSEGMDGVDGWNLMVGELSELFVSCGSALAPDYLSRFEVAFRRRMEQRLQESLYAWSRDSVRGVHGRANYLLGMYLKILSDSYFRVPVSELMEKRRTRRRERRESKRHSDPHCECQYCSETYGEDWGRNGRGG